MGSRRRREGREPLPPFPAEPPFTVANVTGLAFVHRDRMLLALKPYAHLPEVAAEIRGVSRWHR